MMCCSCLAVKGWGQETTYTYYDASWKKIEQKDEAYFYSVAVFKNGLWNVKDYYAKTNKLQNTYSYSIMDSVRQGHYVKYFENGKKESEGEYLDNFQVGKWNSWYENGSKSSEELFLSRIEDIRKVLESDTVLSKSRNNATYGYSGIRNGKNVWYYENGKKSSEEVYKNGRIQNLSTWNEEGRKEVVEIKDPYGSYEPPEFRGNISAFISENIKYPPDARENNIQGKEIVSFTIKPDGTLADCKIVRSVGSASIDAESIRVVKKMNGLFKPGKAHNRNVKVYYTLPLSFKLQD